MSAIRTEMRMAALENRIDALEKRLNELTVRVDGSLNAAYVNYDPIVNQLSELRQVVVELVRAVRSNPDLA